MTTYTNPATQENVQSDLSLKDAILICSHITGFGGQLAESVAKLLNESRQPSAKQVFFIHKLAQENATKTPGVVVMTPAPKAVLPLEKIVGMLRKAAAPKANGKRLQKPGMMLTYFSADGAVAYRAEIFQASDSGELIVYNPDATQGRLFAKIATNGELTMTHRAPATLQKDLEDFAADPEGVAGAMGRLTGKCVFCQKRLTDERSTEVGYGPVCAENYGLEWGQK